MEIEKNKIDLELPEIVSAIIKGYEQQNSTVVSLIHSNSLAGLSGLKLQATLLLRKSRMSKKNQKMLVGLIDQITEDLRIIHNEIYPKMLDHLGLLKCLSSTAYEIEERYSVHVQHENLIDEKQKLSISETRQLSILRLYKAILVRLICEHGALIVVSRLSETNGKLKLEFQIKSLEDNVKEYLETFLVESLDSILARVIGLDAEIDPNSDWDNYLGILIDQQK